LAIRVSCQNSSPTTEQPTIFSVASIPSSRLILTNRLTPLFHQGNRFSGDGGSQPSSRKPFAALDGVSRGASLTTPVGDEPIPLPLLQHRFIIDDDAIILHSIVTYMSHP
jgi:hypothetical protein